MGLTRRQFLTHGVRSLTALGLADAALLEPYALRTTRLDFRHLGLGKTFVHLTDTHHRGGPLLKRALAAAMRHRPDFILFTGDLVDSGMRHWRHALDQIARLPAPVWGVPGNHDPDHPIAMAMAREAFAATGGAWLENQRFDAGNFVVHGISSLALLRKMESKPKILLCHYPAVATQSIARRYDLIVAGHSHAGQVRLPGIGPLLLPRRVKPYVHGEYDTPLGRLYVSAGIGCSGIPVRFFCRPEIVVIYT